MSCRAHAPLTGTIWQVRVSLGETVSAEQEIVVLESMKMEMPVAAPCAGRVAQIHVAEGQAVNEGDLLVTIE